MSPRRVAKRGPIKEQRVTRSGRRGEASGEWTKDAGLGTGLAYIWLLPPHPARARVLQANADCFYYFFMAIVVVSYEAKATASRALTFIVRIFVDDTIAITVGTGFCFHVAARAGGSGPACSCTPLVRDGHSYPGGVH
jgi:hypothetical protein